MLESEGRCECRYGCGAVYEPVCASNGVTFSNSCLLFIAICNGAKITKVHRGRCGNEKILKF